MIGTLEEQKFKKEMNKWNMRLEVLMVVSMSMVVYWVGTLCGLVNGYQHFSEHTSDLKIEAVCSSKMMVPIYISPHCHNPEDHHGQQLKCYFFMDEWHVLALSGQM
jgi:hypothetical protein